LQRDHARALLVVPKTHASGPTPSIPPAAPPAPASPGPPGLAPAAIADLIPAADMTAVRTATLPNGLRVLVARRPGLPVVTVALMTLGGSALARPTGVAEVAVQVVEHPHRYGWPAQFGARESLTVEPDVVVHRLRGGAALTGKLLAMVADRVAARSVAGGTIADFRRLTL